MSTALTTQEFVDAVATEMTAGVHTAVERWMAEIEHAFTDPRLTTLGRVNAVRGILENYKRLTGKTQLFRRGCE